MRFVVTLFGSQKFYFVDEERVWEGGPIHRLDCRLGASSQLPFVRKGKRLVQEKNHFYSLAPLLVYPTLISHCDNYQLRLIDSLRKTK